MARKLFTSISLPNISLGFACNLHSMYIFKNAINFLGNTLEGRFNHSEK